MHVFRTVRAGLVAALAMLLTGGGGTAGAAVITWGPATTIAGDADVSTSGTLVNAVNTGARGVSSTTVNGVTFNGLFLAGATATSGNFTFANANPGGFGSSNALGAAAAPFNALSAAYQVLLGSGGGGFLADPFTLTMDGLTVGHTYQFQWWSNASGFPVATDVNATAGNTVTVDPNTTNADGGLGQYALGTFVADAAGEVITFVGTNQSVVDGAQLRDLGIGGPGGGGGGGNVPLPPAAWTGLASGAALFAARLRQRGGRAA